MPRSKFDIVIENAVSDTNDRIAVALYAHFLLNTSPGCRPSDAARMAVSDYASDPEAVRNRESGCSLNGYRPF